jgi:hypothetical protein
MEPVKLRQERRHAAFGQRLERRTEAHTAATRAGEDGHLFRRALGFEQDAAGTEGEPGPGLREPSRARPSFDQGNAHLFFERPDLLGERRLGHAQPPRRGREAHRIGDR